MPKLFFAALILIALHIAPAMAGPPPGYVLVWADEFSTDGLPDPAKWGYDVGGGWGDNELQYYAGWRWQNSRVAGGKLIITGRHETLPYAPDWHYTSARLVTRGRASWTTGYFEIRAKLPCGQGAWPAIWTLGVGRPWPQGGEIDIMEHIDNERRVHGTIHTVSTGAGGDGRTRRLPTACQSFHAYHLTWTLERLVIGADGVNYHTYRNPHTGGNAWPFGRPQYLLLNLAIGGDWPGLPDDTTVFPLSFVVDYVRVYQRLP